MKGFIPQQYIEMGVVKQITGVVGIRAPGHFRHEITVVLEHGSIPEKIGVLPGQNQDTQGIRLHNG